MGSAGAKVISVVRDVTDAYVHAGGQYEWDSAAPVAVARAAGLFTSRVDGSPLRYNQDDVYLPDLVVCRPELAERDPGPPGGARRWVTLASRTASRSVGAAAAHDGVAVRSAMRRSSDQDQLSTYCRSSRTVSSHDRSDRPETCQSPVMPGFTASRRTRSGVVGPHLGGQRRPRADERHLAPDDVPQLRQLVERVRPQHATRSW